MIAAPPRYTGLRRPNRSASQPRSGQPNTHPSGTIEMANTASAKENILSVWKKRTPQTMSPTVVGTNSNPAARPQREDCGFEKTILYVARIPPLAFPRSMLGVSLGLIHHKPT